VRPWLLTLALPACATSEKTAMDTGAAASEMFCPVGFTYETRGEPDAVRLTGSFTDWAADEIEMTEALDGLWHVELWLPPGAHPYKFVEYTAWTMGGAELWTCDPAAPLIHCEEADASNEWAQDCSPGADACNSLAIVPDCTLPTLSVESVTVDRGTGTLGVNFRAAPSATAAPVVQVTATLNGAPIAGGLEGGVFHVEQSGLSAGRHTIRAVATDAAGQVSEAAFVPAWLDDWTWDEAVLYHALIDRVSNEDATNDASEGTTHAITDFAGGDLAGLMQALPYLDSLGVNAIWVSNPQPAPTGPWAGDCSATYSGYHGFWPADWDGIDAHLGTEETWRAFIDAAHGRNMRVVIDWVGNHIHEDHAGYADWEETAFNPPAVCSETDRHGAMNWDSIPESCWFAPYLPDLDQTDPDVLTADIDSAVRWAQEYDLDGLRVDAAKHMPHAVSWNLNSRIAQSLEHREAGSDFDFYLVGETFDGQDRINAYIGPNQLDGQFDFPLYWALRDAFIYDSLSLADLVGMGTTMAERYPDGRMSTFLGNLDVGRFSTTADEWTEEECVDGAIRQAATPTDVQVYDRLVLAWTFLFTQPGIPLIYYGDELGLPGYGDPDNRQPLWWATDVAGKEVSDVQATLPGGPAWVLGTVATLAQARADHPALATGTTTEWWAEPTDFPTLYAYARTGTDDAVLVILSRWDEATTITNSLAFAGLPTDAVYEDLLTGETFAADGDSLTVTIPPRHARVLVVR
jgi:glycosidase